MAITTVILPLISEARPDQAPLGLERLIQHRPGVLDIGIEPVGEVVKVVFESKRIRLDEITRLLAKYGYPTGQPISVKEDIPHAA